MASSTSTATSTGPETAEIDAPAVDTAEQAVASPVVRESVPVAPQKRKASDASRARAANLHARKLHAIATRRAAAAKMEKAEFIAEIVKGNFKPITAADIANEPTPAAT